MARQRILHPNFFTNPELGQLRPVVRILFQGLWCLADRAGRLADHPIRIKLAVIPFDRGNPDLMLDELQTAGMIVRYEVDGQRFLQVLNFERFQRPHPKEAQSSIPTPPPCNYTASNVKVVASPSMSSKPSKPSRPSGKDNSVGNDPDASALIQAWNRICVPANLPEVRSETARRLAASKRRLAERPLAEWEQVFQRIAQSSFCRGETERGWKADFDWITNNEDNAVKVLEGKYDDRKPGTPEPKREHTGTFLDRTAESVNRERGLEKP